MGEDVERLRELAAKANRLANLIDNRTAKDGLREFARDAERKAAELETQEIQGKRR